MLSLLTLLCPLRSKCPIHFRYTTIVLVLSSYLDVIDTVLESN